MRCNSFSTVWAFAGLALATFGFAGTANAAPITVDSTQQFDLAGGNGLQAVSNLGTFDADGAHKLVVVVSTEHGFDTTHNGDVLNVKYNGVSLTQAVEQKGVSDATAEIWYLDNPGAIGTGTIEISAANPNGGIGAAYALSNTIPGFGSSSVSTTPSVSITTTAADSLVIAVHDNGGDDVLNGGGNGAGPAPTANAPLTQVSSGVWGNQWGAHASGYQEVASVSTVTPTFTTASPNVYATVAASFEPWTGIGPPPPPATLVHDTTDQVSDNHSSFDISVYPGKAGYDDGTDSAIFGDGNVLDYRFFDSPGNTFNGTGYANGGAGLVSTATATNTNGNGESWANAWTTNDPGTDFTGGDSPNFPDSVYTFARSQGVTGTIDISELSNATLYFIHGSYSNPSTVSLTMSGDGVSDIMATHTEDPPSVNQAWISSFDFANAADYDLITYTYSNTDTDGSRARFMGVIVARVPEPSTFVLAVLGFLGLGWYGCRRRRRPA